MSDLRLKHMMDSHGLSPEVQQKVLARLVEVNVAPDDPLSVIFLVEANIEQTGQALANLPKQMTARLRADLTDSNSALVAGLCETVRKAILDTSGRAIRDARRNSIMHLAAACILSGTAIGGLGVALGVQLGQDRSASFLATLAATPEAAAWERLMTANPGLISFMSEHCIPGNISYVPSSRGGPACQVPLWIDNNAAHVKTIDMPSFLGRLRSELTQQVKRTPAWSTFLIGVLTTLAALPLIRWVSARK